MSRRTRSMRELIKALPGPPELHNAMHSLYGQPDRVAAIMATAMVEAVLERLLVASFKQRSRERERAMLGQSGPLATFAAKIQIAAAFGVITEPISEELTRMKNVRNIFAHAATNVSFDTPEIAELADNFKSLAAMRSGPGIRDHPVAETYKGKPGYVLVATLLSILMDGQIAKLGGERVYPERKLEASEV